MLNEHIAADLKRKAQRGEKGYEDHPDFCPKTERGGTEVIIRDTDDRFNNWEGEIVGITGQYLVVRLLYDPHGNKVGKRPLLAFTPLQLSSPVDWEKYR